MQFLVVLCCVFNKELYRPQLRRAQSERGPVRFLRILNGYQHRTVRFRPG